METVSKRAVKHLQQLWQHMASDVDKMLAAIAAAEGGLDEAAAKAFVASLKQAGRYQADVY
jgi:sulfite reductase (NADPH) flavoprotein alpha-component